jgi:class 3 adenylate cyclase
MTWCYPAVRSSVGPRRRRLDRTALFGISEGGPATTALAAAHPDRVSALVLTGTYARVVEAPDYRIGLRPEQVEALRGPLVEHWGDPVALSLFVPEEEIDDRLRTWWARLLRSGTSPAGVDRLIDTWLEIDVRDVLPTIGVPTLIIQRRDDRLTPPRFGRYLAERIPGARYVELPGGHIPAFGDSDAVAEEIEEFVTGRRHAPHPERVLATVLFTDISGSTERAAQLGDRRWNELLAEHDAIVGEEVERWRGRLVKHLGDGVLATFDGPARAIRAAEAIARRVLPLGLEVRAGVHTGEAELRGDDVLGMAVNIGARVAALAGPCEVLVSGTVRDLVVGSDIAFEERGAQALKGVPGRWPLYAVAA